MALTKQEKEQIVSEVAELLQASKLTVVANYKGVNVKQLQELRKATRESGTKVKVVKNRLLIKALSTVERFKDLDTNAFNEQLLYAFNDADDAAPAQNLAAFAKKVPALEFVGALTVDGKFMPAEDVKALASLPGKNELIASLVATLQSPINEVMSGLSGGLSSILRGLEAKASN